MAQVIAELERSHRGDLGLAARMIAEAKRCGADYIKIQAYQTKFLRPGDPAEAALKEAELDEKGIRFLARVCKDEGIKFLATVFDLERVPLIRELSDEVKIGSGEANSHSLLLAVMESKFHRCVIGCGIHRYPAFFPCNDTIALFGVALYPAHPSMAELAVMHSLRGWEFTWGYTDHTANLLACDFAIGLGASLLEVHVAIAGVDKRGAYEKSSVELRLLCESAHADRSGAMEGLTQARADARARYEGRWSHGR